MAAQTQHECFEQPPDPQVSVWRYLSFAKFVDFVATRSLWYSRLDLLDDPFEGTYPEVVRQHLLKLEEELAKQQEAPVARAPGLASLMRSSVYVNCWCLQPSESNALWRIYAGADGGVALRTTYARLVASLPNDDFVGVVRYIDYSVDAMRNQNALDAAMHKRIMFSYEREVRVVRWGISTVPSDLDFSKSPAGFRVSLEASTAIDAIVVSPYAPTWANETLTAIVELADLGVPVLRSSMTAQPFQDYTPVPKAVTDQLARLKGVPQAIG